MSEFNVWSVRDPDERSAWLSRWERSEQREPFAHPTFVELFAGSGTACLAAFAAPGVEVLYPFILRELSVDIPGAESGLHDTTSPYGYGGPFASGSAANGSEFWSRLETWCVERRVVSTFTRLSLFDEQVPALPAPPRVLFGNIVRDLRPGPDEIWKDYAHKVRKNVKRAKSHGLVTEMDAVGHRLDDFIDIYSTTMARRDAADGYRFPPAFFKRLVREMAGSYTFIHVLEPNGNVVSTELALRSRNHLYSFLGGTLEASFAQRPNDLLKHDLICWGCEQGLTDFVLGGGYGAEDGIFQYKLAFAPHGVRQFRVLERVLNPETVISLVNQRLRTEPTWSAREGFFPPYRA